jgi:hypothetical protein
LIDALALYRFLLGLLYNNTLQEFETGASQAYRSLVEEFNSEEGFTKAPDDSYDNQMELVGKDLGTHTQLYRHTCMYSNVSINVALLLTLQKKNYLKAGLTPRIELGEVTAECMFEERKCIHMTQ